MIIIDKGSPDEKGVWFLPDGESYDTEHKAIVSCPDCDHLLSLQWHSIYSNGRVAPSVVCVNEVCKFHKHIQLSGWNKGHIPRK